MNHYPYNIRLSKLRGEIYKKCCTNSIKSGKTKCEEENPELKERNNAKIMQGLNELIGTKMPIVEKLTMLF